MSLLKIHPLPLLMYMAEQNPACRLAEMKQKNLCGNSAWCCNIFDFIVLIGHGMVHVMAVKNNGAGFYCLQEGAHGRRPLIKSRTILSKHAHNRYYPHSTRQTLEIYSEEHTNTAKIKSCI